MFVSLFSNAELVASTVADSLIVCFYKLIPSIFPFMVLSGFLIKLIGNNTYKEKSRLSPLIIFLSWVSGFIVGPGFISRLEEKQDTTCLVFLTSNAGVGFVISYVGVALWGNIFLGIYLYLTQIFTSVVLYLIFNKSTLTFNHGNQKNTIFSSISLSIQEGTHTMLDICGFSVFFSILRQLLLLIINSDFVSLLFASALEISSGAITAVSAKNVLLCAFLTGFTVGFGGICMCMQTFAVCKNANVNKIKFFNLKLLQGLLCGFSMLVLIVLTGFEPITQTYAELDEKFSLIEVVASALFLCSSMYFLKKSLKNKLN